MYGVFPEEDWSPDQPEDDEHLWRYIDFTQFVSILENEELWFSAVAEFFDPFEGALPRDSVRELADGLNDGLQNPESIVSRLYDTLRYTTYANCWHQRNQETAAMWNLYQDKGKEVAIRTTVENLQSALPERSNMTSGLVDYEEYNDISEFSVNRASPFFHKRPSFDHESEYRVVISEFEVADGARIDSQYVEKIDEKTPRGRAVEIDLDDLIQEVVVSPVAGGWVKSLIEDVVTTYGLDVSVRGSDIGHDPF